MKRILTLILLAFAFASPSKAETGCVVGGGFLCKQPVAGGSCASALPNLLINLDASNSASVIRSGANVSAWNDLSGNGNNFTEIDGGVAALYSATSFPGSKPGITLLGTNQYFRNASVSLNSTTLFVMVVMTAAANTGFNGIVSLLGSGGASDFNAVNSMILSMGAATTNINSTRTTFTVTSAISGFNNALTAGVSFDGSNGVVYSDFATSSAAAAFGALGNTTASITLGNRQTPGIAGPYLSGILSEVIITTSVPSGGQLTTLHSCLTTKWGVP